MEIMRKQMSVLQDELQQSIVKDTEVLQNAANDDNTNNDKTEQEKEKHERHQSEMVRKSQLLDLTKEIDALREETFALKKVNTERKTAAEKDQHGIWIYFYVYSQYIHNNVTFDIFLCVCDSEYEEKIADLESKIKSLQITHEPLSKPSFHKKTEEKNKQDLTKKDKEIIRLKEELEKAQTKCSDLETELKETQEENTKMMERTKTMEKSENEKIKSLQSTLKQIHSQHNLDKETYNKELELLKAKDEGFINKIYKQRDEYKTELVKLKKQFKEREHS